MDHLREDATDGSADRTHYLVQVSRRVIAGLTSVGVFPSMRVGLLSVHYLADLAERNRRHWHGIRHTRIRRYTNGRRARTVHDPPG